MVGIIGSRYFNDKNFKEKGFALELVNSFTGYKFTNFENRNKFVESVYMAITFQHSNVLPDQALDVEKLQKAFHAKSKEEKQAFVQELFQGVSLKPTKHSLLWDIFEKIHNYAELLLNPIAYMIDGSYAMNLGFIVCGRVDIDQAKFDKTKFVDRLKNEEKQVELASAPRSVVLG